jgi:hypothetical protein
MFYIVDESNYNDFMDSYRNISGAFYGAGVTPVDY